MIVRAEEADLYTKKSGFLSFRERDLDTREAKYS
jgi:hypothetical protein